MAHSEDQYVELAVRHASNLPALAALRAELRPRMLASPLCAGGPFVEQLEGVYRTLWQRHVAAVEGGSTGVPSVVQVDAGALCTSTSSPAEVGAGAGAGQGLRAGEVPTQLLQGTGHLHIHSSDGTPRGSSSGNHAVGGLLAAGQAGLVQGGSAKSRSGSQGQQVGLGLGLLGKHGLSSGSDEEQSVMEAEAGTGSGSGAPGAKAGLGAGADGAGRHDSKLLQQQQQQAAAGAQGAGDARHLARTPSADSCMAPCPVLDGEPRDRGCGYLDGGEAPEAGSCQVEAEDAGEETPEGGARVRMASASPSCTSTSWDSEGGEVVVGLGVHQRQGQRNTGSLRSVSGSQVTVPELQQQHQVSKGRQAGHGATQKSAAAAVAAGAAAAAAPHKPNRGGAISPDGQRAPQRSKVAR